MTSLDGPKKTVSILVPCYNEEDVLPETLPQLLSLACDRLDYDFEYILIDDGSTDRTLQVLKDAASDDARIKIISFSRNFGHQVAVCAGIDAATGDAIGLIDADLQDPPEVLLDMLSKWEEGYDVVYGVRQNRDGESQFKLLSAKFFYRTLRYLSEVPIPLDAGDFRIIDKRVAEQLRHMKERHKFVRGMVSWVGFDQYPLHYDRQKRVAGVTKYPFAKMLKFAVDGIFSFSTKPLQAATTLGLCAALFALIAMLYALTMRVLTSNWVEGWTALMIAVLFLGGVQLISLGIIGEYLGRIYEEAKNRPLYIVRERIGFLKSDAKINHEMDHIS